MQLTVMQLCNNAIICLQETYFLAPPPPPAWEGGKNFRKVFVFRNFCFGGRGLYLFWGGGGNTVGGRGVTEF